MRRTKTLHLIMKSKISYDVIGTFQLFTGFEEVSSIEQVLIYSPGPRHNGFEKINVLVSFGKIMFLDNEILKSYLKVKANIEQDLIYLKKKWLLKK